MRPKSADPKYTGSFGRFLKTMQAPRRAEADDPSMRLLRIASDNGGVVGMKALLATDLTPLALSKAVEGMEARGLVSVTTTAGDDLVKLTELGLRVLKLDQAGGEP